MLVIGRHTNLVSPFSAVQQYPKAKRFNCHIPSCGRSSSDSYRLIGKKYLQCCTRCKKKLSSNTAAKCKIITVPNFTYTK